MRCLRSPLCECCISKGYGSEISAQLWNDRMGMPFSEITPQLTKHSNCLPNDEDRWDYENQIPLDGYLCC